jgi:hypothetical protein
MSKEKQIEEMARVIYENTAISCVETADEIAEAVYNAGYRKQSEWISVDERLPEPNKECLVAAKVGERMVVDLGERVRCFDCRTMEHSYALSITNDWDEGEGCEITHWMPLPEPPMMKGGAE